MASVSEVLGVALEHHRAGRLREAESLYRQVLQQEPNQPDALHLLGLLAHHVGRHDAAVELIGQAIARNPSVPEYHNNLGEACRALGRLEEAIAQYKQALRLNPAHAEAYSNWGIALDEQGKHEEAMACIQQALALKPDFAAAHNNLGNVLRKQGRRQEATDHYRRAVALNPSFAEAWNGLGVVSQEQGRPEEAAACYRRVLAIQPGYAETHSNLGVALHEMGKLEEAVACHRRALTLRPDYVGGFNNLGSALIEQGKLDEAVACFLKAIEIKPESVETMLLMGNALKDQGKADDAIGWYRRALRIDPDYAKAHSNLLFVMCYSAVCPPEMIAEEHRRWNDRHARRFASGAPAHRNDRDPRRPLRVGYVSGDFLRHPIGLWIEPLLAAHRRTECTIVGYSTVARADDMTARLQASADVWRVLAGLDDDAAARLILDDGIDILVDLSGHSKNHRLLVFARKPAPVQVTYLGSLTTTGLTAMDYKLSDRYLTPPGGSEWFSEQVVRLPGSFICYRAPADAPPVGPLPAAANGYVTFGSFNNLAKVTPSVAASWAKILHAVPTARLLLKDKSAADSGQQARYRWLFEHEGIDGRRLEFRAASPFPSHLAEYGEVDIALDPFPYNGCYTSCEALWMGVPVVTLAGGLSSGRYGVSLLSHLGRKDLIAATPRQYVAKTVALATDPGRLAALRAELRPQMLASPLCDAEALARAVEKAYRRMWQRWCKS